MENFNVNISVFDCCVSKCNTNSIMTTKIFTNTNDFIPLFCNFYLKIISVNNGFVVLSIDNSSIFIVRRAFVDIPLKICLSNGSNNHELTIKVNSIT